MSHRAIVEIYRMVLVFFLLAFVFHTSIYTNVGIVEVHGFGNFGVPNNIFGISSINDNNQEINNKNNVELKKQALLNAIIGTNNGKTTTIEQQMNILQLVHSVESINTTTTLSLFDPNVAQQINGIWYLQYTSPSSVPPTITTTTIDNEINNNNTISTIPIWEPINPKEGSSNIETRPFNAKGTVSAGGIVVDTSNKPVLQIVDTSKLSIINQVLYPWGYILVGGTFRISSTIYNRAIVAFNQATICYRIFQKWNMMIHFGWIFTVIAMIFKKGNRDNGWLETTYVDDTMRIGRGNKGTLFILTRQPMQ